MCVDCINGGSKQGSHISIIKGWDTWNKQGRKIAELGVGLNANKVNLKTVSSKEVKGTTGDGI